MKNITREIATHEVSFACESNDHDKTVRATVTIEWLITNGTPFCCECDNDMIVCPRDLTPVGVSLVQM